MSESRNEQRGRLRVNAPDRHQMYWRSVVIDDLVPADHQVRVIWAFVERMDLSRFTGDMRAREGEPGRPLTDPRLLLALWLYAATEGVGSAREVERLCENHRAYQWLCGDVSVNYHTLSDFRTDHEAALDDLLAQMLAVLMHKKLVSVERISQDGTRVRASAGAWSFRGRRRLEALLGEAKTHVQELKRQMDGGEAVDISARKRAAQERAAREKVERIEEALAQLPEVEAAKQKKNGKPSRQEARVSTTDPDARRMKMPDGGVRPAVNVQVAADTSSRLIVAASVVNAGTDHGQIGPMRRQVETCTEGKVEEHLVDGGYVTLDEVNEAAQEQSRVYMPVPEPRNKETERYAARRGDTDAVAEWRERMGTEEGQAIYKQRAALSETINADLKTHRGLDRIMVRGLGKIRCVVLLSVLAYNLLHVGRELIA